jgi:hypothetical protein
MRKAFIVVIFLMAFPVMSQTMKAYLEMVQESGDSEQWEKAKILTLKRVRMAGGEIAEMKMKLCFLAGYPHNKGTYNDLSRRQVAECDGFLVRIDKGDARSAAEKARKDSEYNKAHPVKN